MSRFIRLMPQNLGASVWLWLGRSEVALIGWVVSHNRLDRIGFCPNPWFAVLSTAHLAILRTQNLLALTYNGSHLLIAYGTKNQAI